MAGLMAAKARVVGFVSCLCASCVWMIRLQFRLVELAWLYVPLPFMGILAALADALCRPVLMLGAAWPRPEGSKDWRAAWLDLALRNVQQSGPVFVKLAQWATTRPDLIRESWCAALKTLQDQTKPHSLEHTHRILNNSFGRNVWSQGFLIEPEPIGSGCIAQVYRGVAQLPGTRNEHNSTTRCGPAAWSALFRKRMEKPKPQVVQTSAAITSIRVAVKVIHPQVRRAVELDLKFLQLIAWTVDRLGFEGLGVSMALRQFVDFLTAQVDFTLEAKNLRQFRSMFGSTPDGVVVPLVIEPWVSTDVLVMSFEEGEPLNTLMMADDGDAEMKALKRDCFDQLIEVFWSMVFKHRLVHGDMHPGNVLWQRKADGKVQVVLIDCGLAVDLHGQPGEDLSMMVRAFLTQSEEEVARRLIKLSERVGGREEDVIDPDGFVQGIAELIREAKKCTFKFSKLNVCELMGRSLMLGRKHHVRFDARFVSLGVSMIVLQGVGMSLHADGDFVARMAPHVLSAAMTGAIGGT